MLVSCEKELKYKEEKKESPSKRAQSVEEIEFFFGFAYLLSGFWLVSFHISQVPSPFLDR